MIDVDDLKSYNDTFGHLEGDSLLKKISRIFIESLREVDTVCRYAGDEFAIILPGTDGNGAYIVANKIKKTVEGSNFKRKVTLSIGAAQYSPNLTKYDFVQKADTTLYQAKKSGKNTVSIS